MSSDWENFRKEAARSATLGVAQDETVHASSCHCGDAVVGVTCDDKGAESGRAGELRPSMYEPGKGAVPAKRLLNGLALNSVLLAEKLGQIFVGVLLLITYWGWQRVRLKYVVALFFSLSGIVLILGFSLDIDSPLDNSSNFFMSLGQGRDSSIGIASGVVLCWLAFLLVTPRKNLNRKTGCLAIIPVVLLLVGLLIGFYTEVKNNRVNEASASTVGPHNENFMEPNIILFEPDFLEGDGVHYDECTSDFFVVRRGRVMQPDGTLGLDHGYGFAWRHYRCCWGTDPEKNEIESILQDIGRLNGISRGSPREEFLEQWRALCRPGVKILRPACPTSSPGQLYRN